MATGLIMQHAYTLWFRMAVTLCAVSRPAIEAMDAPVGFPVNAILAQPFERGGLTKVGGPTERRLEFVTSPCGLPGLLARLPVSGDMLLTILADCEDDDVCGPKRFADGLCGGYWDLFHGKAGLV